LKGFKSFASATTLRFEPGITCVVGPNGSGKSNVVDALSWVMGEQGAKALRGGKMEDVIFAGGANRPPMGMAEVVLTLDNTSGWIPLDFSEVTLTRRAHRSGDNEYFINGARVRLRDVGLRLFLFRHQRLAIDHDLLCVVLAVDQVDLGDFVIALGVLLFENARIELRLRR